MANPGDINNLLHDLQDKLMVNLDTTLRATPASALVRAHAPPSRRRPLSRGRRLYRLPSSADFAAGRGVASPDAGRVLVTVPSLTPRQGHRRIRQPAAVPAAFARKANARPPGLRTFGATLTFIHVTAR
jgi:hypothetical protein